MDEIINYVMDTPGNTNPNVLKGMLEKNSGGDGDVYDAVELINIDFIPWKKEESATDWTASVELDATFMANNYANPGDIMFSTFGEKVRVYIAAGPSDNLSIYYDENTSGRPAIITTIRQVMTIEGSWYITFTQTAKQNNLPDAYTFICKKLTKRT